METCSGVEKAADECWRSTPSTVSLFIRLLETARRASLTIELRADKKYSGGGRGGVSTDHPLSEIFLRKVELGASIFYEMSRRCLSRSRE